MGTTEKYKPARNPTASAQRASHTPTRRLRLCVTAEVPMRFVEDGIAPSDLLSICCLFRFFRVQTGCLCKTFYLISVISLYGKRAKDRNDQQCWVLPSIR